MQLKQRLKKLEEQTINLNSGYCTCYIELKDEVIPIPIEEWKRRVDAGEETDERLPDYCIKCRRTVDKRHLERSFEEHREVVRQRIAQVMETQAKFED